MRLVYLRKDDPDCSDLLPIAFERIRSFCSEVKWDIDQEMLVSSIAKDFVSASPRYMIALAINNNLVIGHLLGTFDTWYKKKYLTVLQYKWSDFVPRETMRELWDGLIKWAKDNGATDLQAMVPNAEHERRLKIFYQFETTMTVMRRPL